MTGSAQFPGSLSELFRLRDADPVRYERIMTEIMRRADKAQKELIERAALARGNPGVQNEP